MPEKKNKGGRPKRVGLPDYKVVNVCLPLDVVEWLSEQPNRSKAVTDAVRREMLHPTPETP